MPSVVIDVPQPPWTEELEISLFRAILSFRPVGIHKSLHLISILNAINSQIPVSEPALTLQDLKTKLNEFYNMEGLEEQEESEETEEERKEEHFEEFELPYQDLVGFIEDHGKGVEGDCSQPASPEATMSVRSGRSASGRGTKRRREESTAAISNTDAGSEEEELASPTTTTTTTRMKRPRTVAAQRKASASATPVASVPPKRRGGRTKKEEGDAEEGEEDEAEETESIAETASVAETDTGPSKGLRTSSRRKAGQEEPSSRGGRGRGRGGRGRGRGRGRGH